ncbi:acyl-CoA dehydrogenase family protein [Salirhabdus sp. Marseille-P4669]|uniref:acyl-CoA dehydrogenase family protein n=1 Tax=Salirhabdus sp. Marseille-P4669 TaxID=2042310 RepID=UPI000C7C53E6|nr:acyl-CoA dehydrogenase family protein [Salirhabdus sp. Marseille-P4669]
MISFQPTKEELSFIEVAKELAIEKIRPEARACEDNKQVHNPLAKQIQQLGFLSLELTEDWEGLELPLISQAQIVKALSYGDLGVVQGIPGYGDAAPFLRLFGNHPILASIKQQLRTNFQQTIALLDVEDQWGANVILTPEVDHYILKGTSQPVRLAKYADYILLFARDVNGQPLIAFLNKEEHQWTVMDGEVRLGLLASGISSLSFERIRIRKENIVALGEEALHCMQAVRTRNYILHAAKEVGLMEAALDYATEYTANRKAFGQHIAKFQGVSFRIASMAIETQVANHLVWEAALQVDANDEKGYGAALRALYRAHRSLRYVTDSAVQLLGGHGFVQEYPVEKWMRDGEAQVMLYGREHLLLQERGEQIVLGVKEVVEK